MKQLFCWDRDSYCPKLGQKSKQSFFFPKGLRKLIFFKKSRQNYIHIAKCLSQTSITNKSTWLFSFSNAKLLPFLQIVLCPLPISLYA